MFDFPVGEKKESFDSNEFDIETYIYFLMEDRFTGVVRVEGEETGRILIIDGIPYCAIIDDRAGNEAIDEIMKIKGRVNVYFLEKERASYTFHWYSIVRRYPVVSWKPRRKGELRREDIERNKLMEALGIKKPSKTEIKKILETEGMSFLMKN
ncbi:MAG: hypothetical protein J7J21_05825 [Methanomicrobia archaeon]|nr:hypothetical protein [Methanomicrobia archaeon]